MLNAGVLGALLLLKVFLYWGAGVNGEWQAGVATIRKKGGDSAVCSLRKVTACFFYSKWRKGILIIECNLQTMYKNVLLWGSWSYWKKNYLELYDKHHHPGLLHPHTSYCYVIIMSSFLSDTTNVAPMLSTSLSILLCPPDCYHLLPHNPTYLTSLRPPSKH